MYTMMISISCRDHMGTIFCCVISTDKDLTWRLLYVGVVTSLHQSSGIATAHHKSLAKTPGICQGTRKYSF